MRSESQIRYRIKQLRFRKLKRHLSKELLVRPTNCLHNVEGSPYRLCGLNTALVCDVRKDGGFLCRKCLDYTPARDKEQIRQDFLDQLNDPNILTRDHADIAALLWVLGEIPEGDSLWRPTLWERILMWLPRKILIWLGR